MADLVLLSKCNNRCISCVEDPSDDFGYKSLEDLKNAGRELEKEKIIAIGGGEPTIHKEFFGIMDYLNSLKCELLLLTNARAFSNSSFLEKFNALKLDKSRLRIASAIYGPDKKTHDAISRTPGSFGETVKGIKNLVRNHYTFEVRIIITKLNYRSLKEISWFIAKEFKGIERVAFISAKYTSEAYKNRKLLFVPFKDVVEELTPAIDLLEKSGVMPMLFHFPHCVLPEKYRKYSYGRTVDEEELYFKEECKRCKYYKDCSGLWRSYYVINGSSEIGLSKI